MQNRFGARLGHNSNCRDRMEKALEEDETGDGKDRARLQNEKMDQCVVVEGEAELKEQDIVKPMIEHGDPRPLEKPNTLDGNDDKMDDTEDLVFGPGSRSDICIATFARPPRPDIILDAPNGNVKLECTHPCRHKRRPGAVTRVCIPRSLISRPRSWTMTTM